LQASAEGVAGRVSELLLRKTVADGEGSVGQKGRHDPVVR